MMAENRKFGLPADVIKLIAIVSMLIDHTGAILQPFLTPELYDLMRGIGRLAFPLFAFFIVEGFLHTRSVGKYLLRLSIFAVLSEIPFDYAFFSWSKTLFYWGHQNVFITLALGLATIWLLDLIRNRIPTDHAWMLLIQALLSVAVSFLGILAARFFRCDYGIMGVFLVLLFYFTRGNRIAQSAALVAWLLFYDYSAGQIVELYAAVDVVFLLLYNGKRGSLPIPKLLFYGFYPVHLLVLTLIRNYLL